MSFIFKCYVSSFHDYMCAFKKKKKIGQVLKTTYENDLKKLSSFSDLYTLMRSKLPHARLNLPCGKKCLVFIFDPNVIFPVISCSYALLPSRHMNKKNLFHKLYISDKGLWNITWNLGPISLCSRRRDSINYMSHYG